MTLNATQDGLRLYESAGFRPTRGIHQHQGLVTMSGPFRPPAAETVRPLSAADASLVQSLDRAATGLDRSAVLQALYSIAAGIVLERRGRPFGFSFLRSFGRGLLIGPVVAPDLSGASALIGHWLAQHVGAFVRVDIPEDDRSLGAWLEQWSLAKVDVVTTMWRGTPPAAENGARVYGLVNQAIG